MSYCYICLSEEDVIHKCKICGDYACQEHMSYAYGKFQCEDCLKNNEIYKIVDIENKIGLKSLNWKGRCHEIASKMQKALDLNDFKLCYGIYNGPVASQSYFKERGVIRHGWLEGKNDNIIDPTRWVFEDVTPYVYFGPNNGEYDFGAEKLRNFIRTAPPDYVEEKSVSLKKLPASTSKFLLSFLNNKDDKVGIGQLVWLSSLGIKELGTHAKPFYKFLIDNNMSAFIPIDFRRAVFNK